MKNLTVIVAGAPEQERLREVTIEPGTRAIDVLQTLGLGGYLLSKEASGQFYAAEESIYEQLEPGAKLRATSPAIVGQGFWCRFWQALVGSSRPAAPPPLPTILPVPKVAPLRAPPAVPVPSGTAQAVRRERVQVKADLRPLWLVRGWVKEENRLTGAYRTCCGSFLGQIDLASGRPSYFIINPPAALLAGPHGSCFRPRGHDRAGIKKYWVHFTSHRGDDIDSGLVAVEGVITEALRQGRRGT